MGIVPNVGLVFHFKAIHMKYTAKTQVALSVALPSGKSMHISFTPITGGGSVFYTNDPAVAKALESHYKFGHLFKRVDAPAPVQTSAVKAVQAKATAYPEIEKKINFRTSKENS